VYSRRRWFSWNISEKKVNNDLNKGQRAEGEAMPRGRGSPRADLNYLIDASAGAQKTRDLSLKTKSAIMTAINA